MDASGADKLILLVQTNQVLYDKSAAGYKVKDALEKGDIWQIGVDIAVNSERTTDLRCRFSFLVSRWRCDRSVRFLVSRFSFLCGGVTGPLAVCLLLFGVIHLPQCGYKAAYTPFCIQRHNVSDVQQGSWRFVHFVDLDSSVIHQVQKKLSARVIDSLCQRQ